jgi:hypothetical protein
MLPQSASKYIILAACRNSGTKTLGLLGGNHNETEVTGKMPSNTILLGIYKQ